MNKTKIEWCDFTWNPIKGLCPVGCWYCYARRIYERFKLDPKPWLDVAELNMTVKTRRTGKWVFVCSTFELFHPIADKWRDMIFDVIQHRPDLTFIVLTKMPENIDCPMPDNVWLGTTVTSTDDLGRSSEILKHKASLHFVSVEPMLGYIPYETILGMDWIIIGRLTGHGKNRDPKPHHLFLLVDQCKRAKVPIFIKNNLREIWGAPLIQEFPK
jgi:protein gp37